MATDLGRLMPGYDFLQGLMKNAGAALPGLPGMGSWITPTLDPAELDKRIQDLKTVQFWLEQNARLLTTTIQALEVQRMTLAALQTMNLPLAELRDALKVETPSAPAPQSPARSAEGDRPAADAPQPADKAGAAAAPSPAPAAAPAIDPLRWWGALTQQFTELAAKAVQDTAADAARPRAPADPPAAAAPAPARKKPAGAAPAADTAPAAPARPAAARKRSR